MQFDSKEKRLLLVAIICFTFICSMVFFERAIGPKRNTAFSIAEQVKQVRSAVVHIQKEGGLGQSSGCLLSSDGIVFTAKHVSDDTPGEYTATLDDGRKFQVKYVIEDNENDVTFFKLDLEGAEPNLPHVKLADSDDLRIGDFVFIVGSPLGRDNFNTVSLGILSALERNLHDRDGWSQYKRFDWHVMMQTTSPAYPGCSGGPVFDLSGRVVGILVAGQDATLNFAVPVARFRDTIETVRNWFRLCRFNVVDSAEEEPDYSDEWYERPEDDIPAPEVNEPWIEPAWSK